MNSQSPQHGAQPHLLNRRQVLAGGVGLAAAGMLGRFGGGITAARAATSTGKPKPGGSARVGIVGASTTDNVDAAYIGSAMGLTSIHLLYAPLVRHGLNFEPQFALAESLEPETSKLDSWIVKLRPGLEFHNGKSVTAADVVYTLQRILNPKSPLEAAEIMADVDYKNVKALDKLTVRIPLLAPNVDFPNELAEPTTGIVPVDYDPRKPIGAGPFKLVSFTAGQQEVVAKFDNYYETGLPLLDEVSLINFADETSHLNALLGGQIDIAQDLEPAQITIINGSSGVGVLNNKCGVWAPIVMNVLDKPFTDVRVREAFKLIIDRPQMLAQVESNQGSLGNDLYAISDPDYDHALPQRHQDLEQAKFLLKQAGMSGMNITLVTSLGTGSPTSPLQAEVFAEQAKGAGVNVTVQNEGANAWNARYLQWPFTQDNWQVIRSYLTYVRMANSPGSQDFETHWAPPAFNKLVSEARAESDDAKRKALLAEAMTLQFNEGGYIIPYFNNDIAGVSDKIGGWVPCVTGTTIASELKQVGFVS